MFESSLQGCLDLAPEINLGGPFLHLKDCDRIYPSYRYSHGTLALRPSNPLLRLVSQLVKVKYSPKNNWTILIYRRNKCLVSGPSTASVAGVRKYLPAIPFISEPVDIVQL